MRKKIRRLYPMAVLSVLCITLLMLFDFFAFGRFENGLIPDVFKFFNSTLITFSGGAVKVGRGINNPLWYVSVLMLCYIVFYCLLQISEKNGIKEIYLFILVCSLGIGIHDYEISLPFLNESSGRGYAAFFYGTILYYIYKNYSHRFINLISYFTLIICFILGKVYYNAFFEYEWGGLTFVVFPSLMFAMMSLETILDKKLFFHLGGISYEIYIWHSFFNQLLYMFREPMSAIYSQPFLFFGIYAFVVIDFSAFMYFLIEKRFTNLCTSLYSNIVVKE